MLYPAELRGLAAAVVAISNMRPLAGHYLLFLTAAGRIGDRIQRHDASIGGAATAGGGFPLGAVHRAGRTSRHPFEWVNQGRFQRRFGDS